MSILKRQKTNWNRESEFSLELAEIGNICLYRIIPAVLFILKVFAISER